MKRYFKLVIIFIISFMLYTNVNAEEFTSVKVFEDGTATWQQVTGANNYTIKVNDSNKVNLNTSTSVDLVNTIISACLNKINCSENYSGNYTITLTANEYDNELASYNFNVTYDGEKLTSGVNTPSFVGIGFTDGDRGVITRGIVAGATSYKLFIDNSVVDKTEVVRLFDANTVNLKDLLYNNNGFCYNINTNANTGNCTNDMNDIYDVYITAYDGEEVIASTMMKIDYENGVFTKLTGPKQYEVTFHSNGGTDVDSQKVYFKRKVFKPIDPTRDGYTFIKWYSDYNLTDIYNFDTPVENNVDLYAQWGVPCVLQIYNKTKDHSYNGGKIVSPNQQEYNSFEVAVLDNDNFSYTAKPDEGYQFLGWTKNNPQAGEYFDTSATLRLLYDPIYFGTYYAVFEEKIIEYTVSFETNGGSLIDNETIVSGQKAIRPVDPTKYGYEFVDWYTDSNLTHKFDFNTSITGDTVLYAKWKAIELTFDDVPKTSWYYEAIKQAYLSNIISGYNEHKFGPNDKITRGQLVTVLYRLDGMPDVSNINNDFSDVLEEKYYTDGTKWAKSNGIVSGYGNTNKFGPNNPIIRQDLAVILNNYAKYKGIEVNEEWDLTGFVDYNLVKGKYPESALKWAVKNRIISGQNLKNGKRAIDPFNNTTRAEAAAMITNYINTYSNN